MQGSDKLTLKNISCPLDADNEGTVKDERGILVQIVDGAQFAHLVYLDLIVHDPPVYRGSHYHEKKLEIFYVITGLIEAHLYDLDTEWSGKIYVSQGDKLTLLPRIAHRFAAREYAQLIEISPLPFDQKDVFPFDFDRLGQF